MLEAASVAQGDLSKDCAPKSHNEQIALTALINAAFEGAGVCHGDELIKGNAELAAMFGMTSATIPGLSLSMLIESEDGTTVAELLAEAERRPCVGRVRGAQGSFPIEIRVRNLHAVEDGKHCRFFTARDMRQQRAAEARLRYLAYHDPQTGLGNRIAMRERLTQLMFWGKESGRQIAALAIDLDHFKALHAVHAQVAADELLREIGWRLIDNVGGNDMVARLGGDQFFIVAEVGLGGRTSIETMAARLVAAMREPFDTRESREGAVTAAIGIAFFPDDAGDVDTLLAMADRALNHVKRTERAGYQSYREDMDGDLWAVRAMEHDIGHALKAGHLSLAYQPQACTVSGRVLGFEALLRWNHPERGLIPPSEFIPLAERTPMIDVIGEWVLRTACIEAASWTAQLRVAVNVSPAQLERNDFTAIVATVLLETGLRPERLELEITETLLVQDPDHALHVILSLKALGVRVAMDDFGTGYSSLSALKRFPFDRIKIDRSFINDLGESEHATAIIRAVIGLGRALHLPILAEGVETRSQLAALRAEGCEEIQGYLIGRPGPIATFRTTTHPNEVESAA